LSLILLGEVDDYSEYLADFNQDGCIDLRDLAGMKVEIVRYNG
jgi:hypothetical protein